MELVPKHVSRVGAKFQLTGLRAFLHMDSIFCHFSLPIKSVAFLATEKPTGENHPWGSKTNQGSAPISPKSAPISHIFRPWVFQLPKSDRFTSSEMRLYFYTSVSTVRFSHVETGFLMSVPSGSTVLVQYCNGTVHTVPYCTYEYGNGTQTPNRHFTVYTVCLPVRSSLKTRLPRGFHVHAFYSILFCSGSTPSAQKPPLFSAREAKQAAETPGLRPACSRTSQTSPLHLVTRPFVRESRAASRRREDNVANLLFFSIFHCYQL